MTNSTLDIINISEICGVNVLTPDLTVTEEMVASGLRRLRDYLDGMIIPDSKFVVFANEVILQADLNNRFKHLKNFLANVNGMEVHRFDMIQLESLKDIFDGTAPIRRDSILVNLPAIVLPKHVWKNSGMNLSFQYTAFRVDLLKRVIDFMLKTETLPHVTSTEIMPLAYSNSIGLLHYAIGLCKDSAFPFDLSQELESEIIEFHSAYMPRCSAMRLVKEYCSCAVL